MNELNFFTESILLFHGNKDPVMIPECRLNPEKESANDFGDCFCMTNEEISAHIWSFNDYDEKAILLDSYVHFYKLNLGNLKILDLRQENYFLQWIATVFKYRYDKLEELTLLRKVSIDKFIEKYYIDISDYDLIIAKCADDRYFSYLRSFAEGEISVAQIKDIIEETDLGTQYCIKSQKAFDSLNKVKEPVLSDKKYTGVYNKYRSNADAIFNRIFNDPKYMNNPIFINDLFKE